MWAAITAIVQLLLVIFNSKFERDKEERKRKDEALKGWDKAVKSGDTAAINNMLLNIKLRK